MRIVLSGFFILTLFACQGTDKPPQFSIREITTKSNETQYAVSVTYEATVLARGDSASTRGPYLVLLEVKRVSGGDPELTIKPTEYGYVPVIDGIGTLAIGGDYRRKKSSFQEGANWPAPKYSATIIGYVPVKQLQSAAVSN